MLALSIVYFIIYGASVAGLLLYARSAVAKDDAAKAAAAALQARFDVASELVSSLKKELDSARASLSEAGASLARREAEAKALSADLERLRSESEAAKSSEREASSKLQELSRETASLSESLKLSRQALDESKTESSKLKEDLKVEAERLRLSSEEASKAKAQFEALSKRLETQEAEMKRLQEESLSKFEALASKLLEEKGDKMSKLNVERLSEILGPLRESLGEFKKRVEDVYEKESKDRAALQEQVRQISEMNRQIGDDAKRLTEALKGDSKVMGDWGETLLDSILEGSGLVEGEQYFKQESVRGDEGQLLRPDVTIKLPHGKTVVVDSKVSISAYVDHCGAKDETAREDAAQRHLRSVKAHVDELAGKDYQSSVGGALDFVVMFIPNEPAYNLAMRLDASLWQYAYDKKIILASPTNLFAILKIVSELWRKEKEASNYMEIAERGASIYDKLAVFLDFLQDVGRGLDDARRAYDKAVNNLKEGRGNLIGQVEKMRSLGLKTKRQLANAWREAGSDEPEELPAGQAQAKDAEPSTELNLPL